ncbi:MAG: hypothetical protein ACLGIK_10160 [Gemmatimonadota bacterium]
MAIRFWFLKVAGRFPYDHLSRIESIGGNDQRAEFEQQEVRSAMLAGWQRPEDGAMGSRV